MKTWYIKVGFAATAPFDEDAPFDVSDTLSDIAAVMSVSRTFDSGTIAITIDAATAEDAAETAAARVTRALSDSGVDAEINELAVQSEKAFRAEVEQPIYPTVLSYAEIAKLAGVSRQRARQFADNDSFPEPVIVTAQGPLYTDHAVRHWLDARNESRTLAGTGA